MSNKRFHRNSGPVRAPQSGALEMGIGAGVLGAAVFFGTLIYDALNNPGSGMLGTRSIVFAIPATVVGGMLGSWFSSWKSAGRK